MSPGSATGGLFCWTLLSDFCGKRKQSVGSSALTRRNQQPQQALAGLRGTKRCVSGLGLGEMNSMALVFSFRKKAVGFRGLHGHLCVENIPHDEGFTGFPSKAVGNSDISQFVRAAGGGGFLSPHFQLTFGRFDVKRQDFGVELEIHLKKNNSNNNN